MPGYVDGFVLPIPRKNVPAYMKMARFGARLWKKHGALQYFECAGDDLNAAFGVPFPKGIRAKKGETVFLSFIVFRSKSHRDTVNRKVMRDPAMAKMPPGMPFDPKRFLYGGFRVAVKA